MEHRNSVTAPARLQVVRSCFFEVTSEMAERVAPRPTATIAARTVDRLLLQHDGAHASPHGPARPAPSALLPLLPRLARSEFCAAASGLAVPRAPALSLLLRSPAC